MQTPNKFRLVLIFSVALALVPWPAKPDEEDDTLVRRSFERTYEAWKHRVQTDPVLRESTPALYECEEFRALQGLGPSAVPMMVEALARKGDPHAHHLWIALRSITKKRFSRRELLASQPQDLWGEWWLRAHLQTPQRFDALYTEWRALEEQQVELLARVKDLGILVIPSIIERLKEGEAGLVPLLSALTEGEVKPEWLPEQCLEWWAENRSAWTVPRPSEAKGE